MNARLPWVLDLHVESGAVFVRRRGREVRDGTEPIMDFAKRSDAEELRKRLCGEREYPSNLYRLPKPLPLAEARALFEAARSRKSAA